jgi:hypothetical protein
MFRASRYLFACSQHAAPTGLMRDGGDSFFSQKEEEDGGFHGYTHVVPLGLRKRLKALKRSLRTLIFNEGYI